MSFPDKVKLVEVGPRDGLQNEATVASVDQRIRLIQGLAATGLKNIEAGSFVSPKWVRQMENTAGVLRALDLNTENHYPVLVPNLRGMHEALDAGAKEIAIFAAASETFSQKNINCSISQSLQRYSDVVKLAHNHGIQVRAYLSCVSGCPYEGDIAIQSVVNVCRQLDELGCYEISLGDTIGVGTPAKTIALIQATSAVIALDRLAVHFHNTYGQALANIYAALGQGVSSVDSSVAGLGGCPYATGASGNVATEDVVYMLHGMNIETGVNLDKLVAVGREICRQLDTPVRSNVNLAYASQ